MIADQIVTAARSWKGTPFRHQGRLKGTAVDCAGFIVLVAQEAGVANVVVPADYRPHEDGQIMLRLLNEHLELVPTDARQAGDVMALCDEGLREPNVPRHLVYVTDVTHKTTFIIHASEHGVREHRIDKRWLDRVHSVWRIRE